MTQHTSIDVFLFEPSYRRLASRIHERAPGIRISAMNERGEILVDGAPSSVEQMQPTAAWVNLDLFAWEGRREFFRALLKSETVRWVQSAAAGVDDPVFARLAGKGIVLTNSDAQGPAMADFILGAVLDYFQNGDERRRLQAQHEWRRIRFRELVDTRWLIVGYGHIGKETARRAQAFGASIVGVRRSVQPDAFANEVVTADRIDEFLPTSDVVVLCVGLNEQTRGMANAEFFARMKQGSVIVNVGRGGLVDESALLAALDRGAPARAVLDVFHTEPLPADSPLWSHPQVRVSAHCSAFGSGNPRRGDDLFLDNLGRFARGEPMRNVVKASDLF
jgi:phosphoglycerate dehydrogenase-like enzyme